MKAFLSEILEAYRELTDADRKMLWVLLAGVFITFTAVVFSSQTTATSSHKPVPAIATKVDAEPFPPGAQGYAEFVCWKIANSNLDTRQFTPEEVLAMCYKLMYPEGTVKKEHNVT